MVPTGTFRTTLSPSRPVQLEPSPWRPRSPLYSGLKRKWTSVLCRSLDSITMSPLRPPSPPEGPPRGTNFSRRKAMHPLPPSPALIRMIASSINMLSILIVQATARIRRGGETPRKVGAGISQKAAFRIVPLEDQKLFLLLRRFAGTVAAFSAGRDDRGFIALVGAGARVRVTSFDIDICLLAQLGEISA